MIHMKKGSQTYLVEMWKAVKCCWLPLQALIFVTLVPSEILIVVFHGLMSGPTADFTYFAIFVITAFLAGLQFYIAALFISAFYVLLGKEIKICDFKRALQVGQKTFPRVLIGLFLCFLLVIGGFIFFILPGFYIAVAIIYVPIVLVLEKTSVSGAFVRSYDLVKGRWWKTLARLWPVIGSWVVLAVLFWWFPDLQYVKGIFFIIAVDVVVIFSMSYVYRMFRDAKRTK